MTIPVDAEIKFSPNIKDEQRFGVRRFFSDLIIDFNFRKNLERFYDESFMAQGYGDFQLSKQAILEYWAKLAKSGEPVFRYVNLEVDFDHFLFSVKGQQELFLDELLSLEGDVEMQIAKVGDSFVIVKEKFYPRMLPSSEEN